MWGQGSNNPDVWDKEDIRSESQLTSALIPGLHSRVIRDGRFGSKVGQIGPKWDKSGAFSDQISVHLAPGRQMH